MPVRDRPSRAAASLWFCVSFFAIIVSSLGDGRFSQHRHILNDSMHAGKLKDHVGEYSVVAEQVQGTLDDILAPGARLGSSRQLKSSSSSNLAADLNEEAQETVEDSLEKLTYRPSNADDSSASSDSQGGSSDSSGSLGESSSSTTSKTSSSASSDSVNLAAELNEEIKDIADDLLENVVPISYDTLAVDKNADEQAHVRETAIHAAKNVPKASDLTASVTERLGSLKDWANSLEENLSNIKGKVGNLECAHHANKLRQLDPIKGLNDTNMVSFVMAFKGIDVIREHSTSVPVEHIKALYTRAVQDSAIGLISKAEFSACCPKPSVTAINVSPRTYLVPPHLGVGGYGVAVDTRVLYGRSDEDLLKRPLLLACAEALKHVMAVSAELHVWEDWIQNKWTISTVESLG